MLNTISFFSIILIFFSLILILAILKIKNTILSLFQFIFCVITISSVLFLLGLEFLPVCLIIIYVGVIAILFLFSLIMYNFNKLELNNFDFSVYFSFFLFPLVKFFGFFFFSSFYSNLLYFNFFKTLNLDFFLQLNYDILSFTSLYDIYSDYIIIFSYLLFVVFLGLKITKD
jgi:NADH:ubiquinone oxidoreductase subunit 6 (subunit J)